MTGPAARPTIASVSEEAARGEVSRKGASPLTKEDREEVRLT